MDEEQLNKIKNDFNENMNNSKRIAKIILECININFDNKKDNPCVLPAVYLILISIMKVNKIPFHRFINQFSELYNQFDPER